VFELTSLGVDGRQPVVDTGSTRHALEADGGRPIGRIESQLTSLTSHSRSRARCCRSVLVGFGRVARTLRDVYFAPGLRQPGGPRRSCPPNWAAPSSLPLLRCGGHPTAAARHQLCLRRRSALHPSALIPGKGSRARCRHSNARKGPTATVQAFEQQSCGRHPRPSGNNAHRTAASKKFDAAFEYRSMSAFKM